MMSSWTTIFVIGAIYSDPDCAQRAGVWYLSKLVSCNYLLVLTIVSTLGLGCDGEDDDIDH